MKHSMVCVLTLSLVLGCGAEHAAGPASSAGGEATPLDWALLLPLETDGLVQIDLARVRRSPYRDSLQPVFDALLGELAEPGMQRGFTSLLERTDLILVALVPSGGDEDDLLILSRGRYEPDEVEKLEASTGARAQTVDVAGHRVWVGRNVADSTAIAQLRPNTLALTADLDAMQHLIARTRMAPTTRRWPPALRELLDETGLENATFGVALAHRSVGTEHGEPVEMSLAGTADADGPFDLTLLVELGDPTLAAAATVFFQTLVQEMAQSARGESFALRGLAQLTRIETVGSRVHGTIHADQATAAQLVPGLMGLVRDALEEQPEAPSIISPLPTPI